MPRMNKLIRYAYSIATSSAAAERVFSLIKRSTQENCLFLFSTIQYYKVDKIQETRIVQHQICCAPTKFFSW